MEAASAQIVAVTTANRLARNSLFGQHVWMGKLQNYRALGCCLLFTVSALHLPAETQAAGQARLVLFPGVIHSLSSPDGSGARIFYRPHIDRDGSQAASVFYEDSRGHHVQVATVSRNLGVSWSPDGQRVFLQNNWGSNGADCYVLTRTATDVSGLACSRLFRNHQGIRREQKSHQPLTIMCIVANGGRHIRSRAW